MAKIPNDNPNSKLQLKYALDEFNQELFSVRDRKSLINIIHNKLGKLISFHDVSISLVDHNRNIHSSFIHYSGVGREGKENFARMTTADYHVKDDFFNVTLNADRAVVWNLAEVLKWKSVPEYLSYYTHNGVKSVLGISLTARMGCLFFLSDFENAFTRHDSSLLQDIAGQISAALTNILFVEEIEKRDREKEVLLDLITVIASIRDRSDMERVAGNQLKKIFSFNDLAIPILNTHRQSYRIFIKHFEKERKISKEFAAKFALGNCDIHDGVLESVLNSHYPMVYEMDELLTWRNVPTYISFWSDNQMKKMVAVPIKSNGESLGAVMFFSDHEDSFQHEDLAKINAIANQLSIAVINILTNEEMRKREHEKEILLSLSNDIAAVRNKIELVSVLKEKLKVLLPFNDLVITIRNENDQYHRGFIHDFENRRRHHKGLNSLLTALHRTDDGVINLTMESDRPICFIVEELLQNEHVPDYVRYYHQTGIKEIVGVAMRNGKEDVGALFLVTEQTNAFSNQHLNLLKSISSQLCIVISNIIANEVILERERDVSALLTFSNEISTVRDKSELHLILNNNFTKLFPSAEIAIVLYDPEYKKYYSFFGLLHPESSFSILGTTKFIDDSTGNGLLEQISTEDGPVVVHVPAPDGQNEFIGVTMHNGNLIMGGLYIAVKAGDVFKKSDYNLLQGIADQLSFTVINILANENILKRESEKTILLEMSKDMAKVRNKMDLHRIVNEKLKKILPYSHCLTMKLDDKGQNVTVFLEGLEALSGNSPELAEIMKHPIPINDGILDYVLSVEQPVVFDLAELMQKPSFPKYVALNYELGIKEIVVMPFSDSKRSTGFLVIFSAESNQIDNNHLSLVQGLSSQLSIVMSNIIANDKIEKQVLEISNFKHQLEVENLYLQEEIHTAHNYSEIIGTSRAMNEMFYLISQVSESQSSVLLLGETGTGKELIARAIHNTSLRKGKLMVKVNCATLPANLIESELFGHERGSFTGAVDKRIGKFELANNSTLFLDEIGELPLDLQVKLLRALQEKEIERLGGHSVIKVDVRVIAATNRNLEKEVQSGNFRSDLFFRLNVFPITIPPLRDRKDDIPKLAAHFLEKYAKKSNRKVTGFSNKAIAELIAYDWPGNVRELEHLIERTILLTHNSTINHMYLPIAKNNDVETGKSHGNFKTIDEIEREHIITVLKSCQGKVGGAGGAAELLKIPATTLHSKMKRLGIGRKYSSG